MPITEFAVLRLKPDTTLTNPHLLTILSRLAHETQKFTSHPFRYYTLPSDSSRIYCFGQWESLDSHLEDWIPSETNQVFLKELEPCLEIDAFCHLDVENEMLPLTAGVIVLGRHVVKKGRRVEIQEWVEEVRSILEGTQGVVAPVGAGWETEGLKIENGQTVEDEGRETEEWVLFSGWESMEQYRQYGNVEWKVYDKAETLFESVVVKVIVPFSEAA